MGIIRIFACHQCKEYCDLDKSICYNLDVYIFNDLKEIFESEIKRGKLYYEYELFYLLQRLQFLWKHKGHNIEEIYDTDDEYYKVIYGKTLDESINFDKDKNYVKFEILKNDTLQTG